MKIIITRLYLRDSRKGFYTKQPKSRVYAFRENVVQLISDSSSERYTQREIRKQLKKALLESLEGVGVVLDNMKWSQYAGCSCPCSPGFITDMTRADFPFDFFADYKIVEDDVVWDNKKLIDVQVHRIY